MTNGKQFAKEFSAFVDHCCGLADRKALWFLVVADNCYTERMLAFVCSEAAAHPSIRILLLHVQRHSTPELYHSATDPTGLSIPTSLDASEVPKLEALLHPATLDTQLSVFLGSVCRSWPLRHARLSSARYQR